MTVRVQEGDFDLGVEVRALTAGVLLQTLEREWRDARNLL